MPETKHHTGNRLSSHESYSVSLVMYWSYTLDILVQGSLLDALLAL